MDLTELYQKGENQLRQRDIGIMLDGVETGFGLSHDRKILDQYSFKQRCIDAVEASTECRVLGVTLATPVIMSAMTMPISAIVEKGLVKTARGLKSAGSLMWTGTPIPQDLKELAGTGVALAANVKPFQDRDKMVQGIEEILEAGVHWLGIEIDAGVGTKIRDRLMATGCSPLSSRELSDIRKRVSIPLIFKGVLSGLDAQKCVDAGADGIIISNHGAHTLDYLAHPLQVMEEVAEAVKGKTVIMIDGGFRRGSDVLKGLAFGATLVGLGRPILYGLAAAGQEGVEGVIEGITQELKRIMIMVGAPDPTRVPHDILVRD
jgi:isopentenyl diphosphate isomerase/L-lactate dehydrogenase-like FMN-dependent dehydrogenase